MRLNDLLRQKESAIKQRWLDLIIATYPVDSREYFKGQKDRFLNPVGAAISQVIEALYAHLPDRESGANVSAVLEEIVRVRAVQDFSPSQAIGFILYFKHAVREELADEIQSGELFFELSALETRIDRVLLEAFDVYMKSRERIYQIRANDLKRKSYLALRKMDPNPRDQEHRDDL